jgi:hypothetical protein
MNSHLGDAMGLRETGRWLVETILGPRQKPTCLDKVTLPDLIEWFLDNKGVKANDIIAFSYFYKLPARPPVRLRGMPKLDETASGVIFIQGYYNQKTEEVLRFRTIYTQHIDDEVAESHAGKEMVVYQ